MKRSIFSLLAASSLALGVAGLAGCGGGAGSPGTGAATRSGNATMKVVWPDRSSSRFIPVNANTIKLEFFLPSDFDASGNLLPGKTALKFKWLDRPYLPATAPGVTPSLPERTQQYTFTGLPVGSVLVHATAYVGRTSANFDAVPPTFVPGSDTDPATQQATSTGFATSAAAIAGTKKLTANVIINIQPKELQTQPEPFVVTMASTIKQIFVQANSSVGGLTLKTGDSYLLTATPVDANNQIVMVDPSRLSWSNKSGSGLRFLSATGGIVHVLAGENAAATGGVITVTEGDSGVSSDLTYTVSLSGYGGFDGVGIPGVGSPDASSAVVTGDGSDIYISDLQGVKINGSNVGGLNDVFRAQVGSDFVSAERPSSLAPGFALRDGFLYEIQGSSVQKSNSSFGFEHSIPLDTHLSANSVSVDATGNIYVFGRFINGATNEYRVYKFSPSYAAQGFVSVPVVDTTPSAINPPTGEASVDDTGAVYFKTYQGFGSVYTVRKLNPDGTVDASYKVNMGETTQFVASGAGYLYTLDKTGSPIITVDLRTYDRTGAHLSTLDESLNSVQVNWNYVSKNAPHDRNYVTTDAPIMGAGLDALGNMYFVHGGASKPVPDDVEFDDEVPFWGFGVQHRLGRAVGLGKPQIKSFALKTHAAGTTKSGAKP
jgi:hypothetical protein